MWMKVVKMSVREAISAVAGPREWGDTRESWLAKAARNSRVISYRMMRSLWTGEIAKEEHWAVREIRRQAELAKARREAKDLAARYEEIAGGLDAKDADFHREDVAALIHAARILRGLDRA